MKLTIRNLGIIESDSIETGDLTIICGKNNLGKTYLTYAFYGMLKDTNVIIKLRLNFYKSPQDAFGHLQEMLSYCSAPLPLPNGKEFGFDIGDCCFFGYPHGSFKAVFFIRNNVVVSMRSSVDIVNVAKCLDQQILSLSTNTLFANP